MQNCCASKDQIMMRHNAFSQIMRLQHGPRCSVVFSMNLENVNFNIWKFGHKKYPSRSSVTAWSTVQRVFSMNLENINFKIWKFGHKKSIQILKCFTIWKTRKMLVIKFIIGKSWCKIQVFWKDTNSNIQRLKIW